MCHPGVYLAWECVTQECVLLECVWSWVCALLEGVVSRAVHSAWLLHTEACQERMCVSPPNPCEMNHQLDEGGCVCVWWGYVERWLRTACAVYEATETVCQAQLIRDGRAEWEKKGWWWSCVCICGFSMDKTDILKWCVRICGFSMDKTDIVWVCVCVCVCI